MAPAASMISAGDDDVLSSASHADVTEACARENCKYSYAQAHQPTSQTWARSTRPCWTTSVEGCETPTRKDAWAVASDSDCTARAAVLTGNVNDEKESDMRWGRFQLLINTIEAKAPKK